MTSWKKTKQKTENLIGVYSKKTTNTSLKRDDNNTAFRDYKIKSRENINQLHNNNHHTKSQQITPTNLTSTYSTKVKPSFKSYIYDFLKRKKSIELTISDPNPGNSNHLAILPHKKHSVTAQNIKAKNFVTINNNSPVNTSPLVPANPFLNAKIPDWLISYSTSLPTTLEPNSELNWNRFELGQLETFEAILKRLFMLELEKIVMKYEAFRLCLAHKLEEYIYKHRAVTSNKCFVTQSSPYHKTSQQIGPKTLVRNNVSNISNLISIDSGMKNSGAFKYSFPNLRQQHQYYVLNKSDKNSNIYYSQNMYISNL